MPPCLDVYVWVAPASPGVFERFIDTYAVDALPDERLDASGREYVQRLDAFRRVYVQGLVSDDDKQTLAEASHDGEGGSGFSLYLSARQHAHAIVTVTRDGAAVLGLSLDDPDFSPEVLEQAERLLEQLRAQFSAAAGIAGVELPPPLWCSEWHDAEVLRRVGDFPACCVGSPPVL